jgi:ribonucleoside-triphosphate reductase
LHENDESLREGLKVISHLYFAVKDEGKKYGMKITIEESPAESASRRLAKIDLKNFACAREFVRGSLARDEVYYTNSIHLRPDADVDIVERIVKQAKFHSLIESGAIIHAFVGENRPSAGAIASLVRKTFEHTNAAQLTISPEFTICKVCHQVTMGIASTCKHCGAVNELEIRRGAGVVSAADKAQCCEWNRDNFTGLTATVAEMESAFAEHTEDLVV